MSLWDDRVCCLTAEYLQAKLEYEQMELALAGEEPSASVKTTLKAKLENINCLDRLIHGGLCLGETRLRDDGVCWEALGSRGIANS